MANKNFILLSLEDSETKKIANVVSNESCRKILDYLSKKEATESELAEKLQLPISTVHYNLQQLINTGLISAEEFHYSEKGKEVLHYKLANKYIIISPKKTYGIKQKLRSILPVGLIAVGAAALIQIFSKYLPKTTFKTQVFAGMKTKVLEEAIQTIPEKALDIAPPVAEGVRTTVEKATVAAAESAMPVVQENITTITEKIVEEIPTRIIEKTPVMVDKTIEVAQHNIALWFLAGALFALAVYCVWNWVRKDIS